MGLNVAATSFDLSSACIMGYGSIGQRHASNLTDLGAYDVSIVDPDPTRRATAEASSAVNRSVDLNSIDYGSFAFGIIAAPSSLHADLARPFIKHETPVFIEKPLHHDIGPARRLAAEVDTVDVTTLVGCNMRFHPGLQTTRRLLRDQRVGEPLTATIFAGSYLPGWHPDEDYRQSYSARPDLGGGVTLDAVHEINYARWLFGEVTEVTAWIDHVSSLEIDTEDLAQLHLRFDTGVSAQLHLDYFHRPYRRGCHITTTDGSSPSRCSRRWW